MKKINTGWELVIIFGILSWEKKSTKGKETQGGIHADIEKAKKKKKKKRNRIIIRRKVIMRK